VIIYVCWFLFAAIAELLDNAVDEVIFPVGLIINIYESLVIVRLKYGLDILVRCCLI